VTWQKIGTIRGPKGDTGPNGIGTAGPQGPTGPTGPAGAPTRIERANGAAPLLAIGAAADVAITWPTAMPSATYTVKLVAGYGLLGRATLALKSQTAAGIVVTVTATLAVTAGSVIDATAYA
jgi:hypothetical protein